MICYGCCKQIEDESTTCECGFNLNEYECKPHYLAPGTVLNNRYMVGKVLGEGGFGITYIGYDQLLDMKIAVKEFYMSAHVSRNFSISGNVIVNKGDSESTFEENREKYLNEARVLAKFTDEDGIVGIRDFFKENNTAYIVMDYVSGKSLRDILTEKKVLDWKKTAEIMDPGIRSLKVVHDHTIIHRDISPDNIKINEEGKVKLLDFGAAREILQYDKTTVLRQSYAPIEQYQRTGEQGPWTDIYALCATMYECVTGVRPEDARNRSFEDTLQAPVTISKDCSIAFSNIIMRGMALYKDERYQSLDELQEDIKKALANPDDSTIGVLPDSAVTNDETEEISEASPAAKSLPKRLLIPALCLAGVAIAVIIAALFFRSNNNTYDASQMHIYFEVKSEISEESVSHAFDVLNQRLSNLLGSNYSITELEDHYELIFPYTGLDDIDIRNMFGCHIFNPDELYIVHNAGEFRQIRREDIANVNVLTAPASNLGLNGYEIEAFGDDEIPYIEILLNSAAAEGLCEDISSWQSSAQTSGLYSPLISWDLEDLPSDSTDEESEQEDFSLSCYLDLDKLLKGSLKKSDTYMTNYIRVDEDASKIIIAFPKASEPEYTQMAYSFSNDTFNDIFTYYIETPCIWEQKDTYNDDKVIWGHNQVDASYFNHEGLDAYDIVLQESNPQSETYGTWFDARAYLIDRLDKAEIPYSVGSLNNDKYSVVIRIPAIYYMDQFTNALCRSNDLGSIYLYDAQNAVNVSDYENYNILPNDSSYSTYYANAVKLPANQSYISKIEMNDNKIMAYINLDNESEIRAITDKTAEFEPETSFRWLGFYGHFDFDEQAFIFDKSTYSMDGSVPAECSIFIALADASLAGNDYISYYHSYSTTNCIQYCTYAGMKENSPVSIHSRTCEVISENIKNKIQNVSGVAPTITYSDNQTFYLDFFQNITENYASYIYRIIGSITDAEIYGYNGLFTLPLDSRLFLDFHNDTSTFSRVIFSKSERSINLLYWRENVSEEDRDMLEDQLIELKKLLQNDSEYSEYDISVTVVTQGNGFNGI